MSSQNKLSLVKRFRHVYTSSGDHRTIIAVYRVERVSLVPKFTSKIQNTAEN